MVRQLGWGLGRLGPMTGPVAKDGVQGREKVSFLCTCLRLGRDFRELKIQEKQRFGYVWGAREMDLRYHRFLSLYQPFTL